MQPTIRAVLVTTATAAGMVALGPVTAFAVGAPLNVRGTITRVSGHTIDIAKRGGGLVVVHLTKHATVAAVTKATLSEVKPGSYIGTTAVPQRNGTLRALEIHIFPASMRGVGEGTRPWNLAPRSSMTNGTVAQKVERVSADTITVDYRGGHKVVTVTPKTKVVALVPGSRSELQPKAKIFIPHAIRNDNGSLEASRVTVGKNGVVPPM